VCVCVCGMGMGMCCEPNEKRDIVGHAPHIVLSALHPRGCSFTRLHILVVLALQSVHLLRLRVELGLQSPNRVAKVRRGVIALLTRSAFIFVPFQRIVVAGQWASAATRTDGRSAYDIAIVFAGMHGFGMLKQGGVMWGVMRAAQRIETSY
jgi:hypothetical protein